MTKRIVAGAIATLALLAVGAGTASADPKGDMTYNFAPTTANDMMYNFAPTTANDMMYN